MRRKLALAARDPTVNPESIFRKLNLKQDFDEHELISEKEKETVDRLLSDTKGNTICGDHGIPSSAFEVCKSASSG